MKVLFIDIETSPNLAWTFGTRKAYIAWDAIVEPSRTICFAASWLDDPNIMFYSEWQHGHDGMIGAAYNLLGEADVVIHYNGERFDEKRLNQEFALLGWAPPAPYQRIDLWRTISSRFDLPSQKLDYVLHFFGLGGKLSTGGIRLWMEVLAGNERSRKKFEDYNRNDVGVMKPLYAKLLPWIKGHPNVNLYDPDEDGQHKCPHCGSYSVQKRGFAYTQVSTFQRYRCNKCGTWSRAGKRDFGSDLRAVAL